MSIVAYAIRTCLGAALVGKTRAGHRIHDSAIQPLSDMIGKDAAPFIVISTDDETLDLNGWQLGDAEREMDVVIEVAVGSLVRFAASEDEEAVRFDVPPTDEGLEFSLNVIWRQIEREMLVGGPWSDLLREFAFRPKRMRVQRGASAEQGSRFAARQYVITTDTIAEPEFGVAPQYQFARLLELMAADEGRLSNDVPVIRAAIIGEPLPEWRRAQADLGLTEASYKALGLGPFFAKDGEPIADRFSVRYPDRTTVSQREVAT